MGSERRGRERDCHYRGNKFTLGRDGMTIQLKKQNYWDASRGPSTRSLLDVPSPQVDFS